MNADACGPEPQPCSCRYHSTMTKTLILKETISNLGFLVLIVLKHVEGEGGVHHQPFKLEPLLSQPVHLGREHHQLLITSEIFKYFFVFNIDSV